MAQTTKNYEEEEALLFFEKKNTKNVQQFEKMQNLKTIQKSTKTQFQFQDYVPDNAFNSLQFFFFKLKCFKSPAENKNYFSTYKNVLLHL